MCFKEILKKGSCVFQECLKKVLYFNTVIIAIVDFVVVVVGCWLLELYLLLLITLYLFLVIQCPSEASETYCWVCLFGMVFKSFSCQTHLQWTLSWGFWQRVAGGKASNLSNMRRGNFWKYEIKEKLDFKSVWLEDDY